MEERERSWYKKLGGGSVRTTINGRKRIIKKNESFQAFPEELPKNSKDCIIPLDRGKEINLKKEEKEIIESNLKKKEYKKVESTRHPGEFNIVDSDGKKLNEKTLSEEDADTFLKELS
jgi:hypothetical protein